MGLKATFHATAAWANAQINGWDTRKLEAFHGRTPGEGLAGQDLSGYDLRGANLSEADLKFATLPVSNFATRTYSPLR